MAPKKSTIIISDGHLCGEVCDVPIHIHKENVGISYHYCLLFDSNNYYQEINNYMQYAIPIISQLLEKHRGEALTQSDF